MPIQLSINIGETVGQTYITEKLLAAGKTSNVFVARSKLNTEAKRVALKVYPIDIEQSTLNNDIAVLQSIGGKTHFSNCLEQGTYRKFSYLALELLGPTLSDIMKRPQMKKLNLSSVVKVGIQGLEALSILHSAGFVHGQVCMENFAIGYTQETAGNLYLIDFTGSKRIDDESLNKGNKTNEDRLSTKIRLVQNDLQCLMKMMMTLYRGGEENQEEYLNNSFDPFNDYDQIQSEIIQLNTQISKIDIESIGYYEGLILVLQILAESNGGDLTNPFEWEFEIVQQAINETKKHKMEITLRQQSLCSLLDELKNPKTIQDSKEHKEKALQLALQSLPQSGEQFILDLSTTTLLQIAPKFQRQMRIQELEHHTQQSMDQGGSLRKAQQHSLLNPFSSNKLRSLSQKQLFKSDSLNQQQQQQQLLQQQIASRSLRQFPQLISTPNQALLNSNNLLMTPVKQIMSPPLINLTRINSNSPLNNSQGSLPLQQQQLLQQQSQPGLIGLFKSNSRITLNNSPNQKNKSLQQFQSPIQRQRSSSVSILHGVSNQSAFFHPSPIKLDQQYQFGHQPNNILQPLNMNQYAKANANINKRNLGQNTSFGRQRSASMNPGQFSPLLAHNSRGLFSPLMFNQQPIAFQNQKIQSQSNYSNIQLNQQNQQPMSQNAMYQPIINTQQQQQQIKDNMQMQQQQQLNIPRPRNAALPHSPLNVNEYFNHQQQNMQQQQHSSYSLAGFGQSSSILEPVIEYKNQETQILSELSNTSLSDKYVNFHAQNSDNKTQDETLNKDSIMSKPDTILSPFSSYSPLSELSPGMFRQYFDPFDISEDSIQSQQQSNDKQKHPELPSQIGISIERPIRMSQQQPSKTNSQQQSPQAVQQTSLNQQDNIQNRFDSSYSIYSPPLTRHKDLLQTPDSTNQVSPLQKPQKQVGTSPLQQQDGSQQHSQQHPHLLYQQHPFFSHQLSTAMQSLYVPDSISPQQSDDSSSSNNNSDNQKLVIEQSLEITQEKNNGINVQKDENMKKVSKVQRRKVNSKQESPMMSEDIKVPQSENKQQNVLDKSIGKVDEEQIKEINSGEQYKSEDANQQYKSSPQIKQIRKKIQSQTYINISTPKEQQPQQQQQQPQQQVQQSTLLNNFQQLNSHNDSVRSISNIDQIYFTRSSNSSQIPLNKNSTSQFSNVSGVQSQQSLVQPDILLQQQQQQQNSPLVQSKTIHTDNPSSPNSSSFYQSQSQTNSSTQQQKQYKGSPQLNSQQGSPLLKNQQKSPLLKSQSPLQKSQQVSPLQKSQQISPLLNSQCHSQLNGSNSQYLTDPSQQQQQQQQQVKTPNSPLNKAKRVIQPVQAKRLSPKLKTLNNTTEQNLNITNVINENEDQQQLIDGISSPPLKINSLFNQQFK